MSSVIRSDKMGGNLSETYILAGSGYKHEKSIIFSRYRGSSTWCAIVLQLGRAISRDYGLVIRIIEDDGFCGCQGSQLK